MIALPLPVEDHENRPLHRIPILVKDNIVTKDNLDASAGSFALLGAKPAVESSVISKLREAGVVILGRPISPNGPTLEAWISVQAGALEMTRRWVLIIPILGLMGVALGQRLQ